MNDQVREVIQRPRTLRVFVPGWVIGDGSFPRAAVGDVVDVSLVLYSAGDAPSVCNETRTAIACPAYGRAPVTGPDGALRWLHLVYGDGWSSQWWTDSAVRGPVTLTGVFSADLEDDRGQDRPGKVYGRARRIHLVERRVSRLDNGWGQIPGSDRLSEVGAVPNDVSWWPTGTTRDGDFVAVGVLVELDLNTRSDSTPPFRAGAVAVHENIVWVMHASDPTLLRVDASHGGPPNIVRYTLPLPIENLDELWTRRVHADGNDGCWITSPHDIHRCTLTGDGELNLDRYTTAGGRVTTVHQHKLYVLGRSRAWLSNNRRHGTVRTEPDLHRLHALDDTTRRLIPVTDPELERTVTKAATRADVAVDTDGTTWSIVGREKLRRINQQTSDTSTVPLSGPSRTGVVRIATPDPYSDPINAALLAAITVDPTRLKTTHPPTETKD
ncbi:hypothetical protein HG717_36005 (plasmid) [Rhodococcus erythropolis]|uniref:hypothetical protein n=1 Tax=Rhodococcus erythropolis TaxID=1833 RepID=UPI001368977A|nr:hypothetical protein [Rhodococcus erythropolis]MBY6389269.1 hypothetical protein [Rhodococcus erythropolis]MYV32020.1 hypothetical protein [Rhodococcus erythropolis]